MSVHPPNYGFSPPTTTPPGWYADPQGYGQRYWDGSAWTPNVAPLYVPPPQSKSEAASGDWIGGALIALLFPVIGFIVGLVYVTKDGSKRQVGAMTLGLSCVAFAFWLVLARGS
jgi:hypothetical protein